MSTKVESDTTMHVDSDDFHEGSLRNIIETTSLKWIFVGGKGGVGKTTTSCSLAAILSKHRESVLLISTDPAHNISDAFGQKFGSTPSKVPGFDNLFAMEIESKLELDTGDVLGDSKGAIADLISSVPGIDEAVSFAELMKHVNSLTYSCVVFDTAPTGHTLRLLSFPTVLEKAFKQINILKNKFGHLFQSVANMANLQNQEEKLAGKLEQLQETVKKIGENFQDPSITTFICVCIPEFLSLFETERLVQELTKFGIDTQNIVVNQVLMPDEGSTCRKCKARVKMQTKYLDQIDALYDDFHVVKMPLLDEEVRGADALLKFGAMLESGKPDPLALTKEC